MALIGAKLAVFSTEVTMRSASCILAVFTAIGILTGGAAMAQSPYSGYRPASPTLSPWMNLFQRNTGPLDNYHSYVRPQLEMQQTFRDQEALNQRQGAAMGSMQRQMTRIEAESKAPVSPTGTGSTFMNLSHYYPSQTAPGYAPRANRSTWSPQPARSFVAGDGF